MFSLNICIMCESVLPLCPASLTAPDQASDDVSNAPPIELMELAVEPLLGLYRLMELFLEAESYRGNGYSLWLCGSPGGSEERDDKLSDEGLL